MHELLENSGGPFIVILPDLKEAPLNSQQFLGDCSQKRKRKVVFPKKITACVFSENWEHLIVKYMTRQTAIFSLYVFLSRVRHRPDSVS